MADSTARGRFVWHELMTPNSAGAHTFYSKTLGWKIEPWQQDPSYSMFAAESGPLGGSTESHDGVPYWIPYVEVPDVDATIRQATDLGASVTGEPSTMSNGGRHAALTDPQGGLFGIYSSSAESGPDAEPGVGEFSWHELVTTDNLAAFDFYSALFGWQKYSEFDMGPMGIYLIFGRNDRQMGGIFNKGDQGRPGPAYWLGYVRVDDVRDTVKKVEAERGSLVAGPMEVPSGDWIAQFVDPHGALFAVQAVAADMKAGEEPVASESAFDEKTQPEERSRPAKKKAAKKKPSGAKATGKKATGKKTGGKKAVSKKAGTKKSATKKVGAKKKAKAGKSETQKSRTKKAKTKKASTKKAATKKAATKKSKTKKAGTKKAPTKKSANRKSAAKKAGTKKSVTKKAATKKSGTKKSEGKKSGPRKAATKKAAVKKTSTAGRNRKSTNTGKRKAAKRR